MVSFEFGNPQTIEELTRKEFAYGKFVFRRDDSLYKLFMGEYDSHPNLVSELKLLGCEESQCQIWGGGDFRVSDRQLVFFGSSGYYGKVPNSFLIACLQSVRVPNIEKTMVALSPYYLDDPELDKRRETWREIGGFELDTERVEYLFDNNMKLLSKKSQPI